MSSRRTALPLVFSIMVLDVMGITILFPVGAFLVQRYSGDALMVTLLTAIYAAAQFLAAPILGKLSDRLGRRPVLLASLLGSAAGYVLFGLGGALWVLFVSRAVDGVTGGNMSTATAYIADVSRPEERSANFGLVGVAWGVGLVLGPALGAVAGQLRLELPAYVAAGLSLLAAALCWRFLPESLSPERRERGPLRLSELNPFASMARILGRPGILVPLLGLSLFQLVFQGTNAVEGLFFIQRFNTPPWQLGACMVAVGVTVAAAQTLGVRRLLPRHGERRVAVGALSLQGLAHVTTVLAPGLVLAAASMLLRHAASGFVFPALGGLVSRRTRAEEQGELMGVTTAIGSVTSVLGPVGAGAVHQHVFAGASYWVAALLAGLAAFLVALPSSAGSPSSARTAARRNAGASAA